MSSSSSRREVLRLVGAGAAVGLARAFVGCGDNTLLHEPASAVLEPTAHAVLASVFAPGARGATVTVRAGDAVVSETAIALATSGAGVVELGGLAPATTYELAFALTDGTSAGTHRARTAPRDDDARAVRLAVFADVDPNPEFDTDLVDHVIAAAPDALISIGDFPYTDNGPGIAETAAAYRARHLEIRTLPRIRALLEAASLYAIYDDHEFRNNWDATRAQAEPDRYAAAMAVWDEFFPMRQRGEIKYRRWRYGANVECFLLDCRRFRSANDAPDDDAKTMLGATQRDWLVAALAASTAPWKLVFTSVPLGFGNGDDHWSAFATERDRILAACAGIAGVVFVSADQHWFAAHRHAFGLREFQFGPLARGIATPGPPADGVLFRATQYNVGVLDVAPDHLTVTALGPGGVKLYEETLS